MRKGDSRKATKGGKFIPWIRAFSFPMAVLCILGFVNVGNINYGLRLAYMFVTYGLYEALYTCVNVPFGTLSSVMTDDDVAVEYRNVVDKLYGITCIPVAQIEAQNGCHTDTHIAVYREIEEDLDRVAEERCQILETREGLRRIKHPVVVRRNTDDDRAVAVIAVSRCTGTCSTDCRVKEGDVEISIAVA